MSEWKTVRLGDIFDLQMGKTPDRKKIDYFQGFHKWISIADISKSEKYISETKECLSDEAITSSGIKSIPKDTLIMSFKLSIGKTAITSDEMYSNEAIMAFLPNGKCETDNSFLYHLFSNKDWSEGSNKAVKGITLNKASLSEAKIPLPPLEEQKHIAAVLDKCTALIAKHKHMLEKYDTLIKSRFIEMFGDISTGNYKFETRKLGSVSEVGSSHRVFTTEFVEQGVPFYRGTEIGMLANGQQPEEPFYISEEHYNRLTEHDSKPKIGDLLMPSICNKGQVWMVDTESPFYYKDGRVLSISPNQKIYNSKYLQYFMREKTIVEYPKLGSGSTFAEFKIFLLKDIDVLTPPISLQNDFATYVQQIDKSKFEIWRNLELCVIIIPKVFLL